MKIDVVLWTDRYQFAKFQGASWIKLFHHKVYQTSDFFDKTTDIFQYINSPNKYSIIGEYQNISRYDSTKYEFLLYYTDFPGFNRWSQTYSPSEDPDIKGNKEAIGYQKISISWTNNYWGGLVSSSHECTAFDGSVGIDLVYYAIGYKKSCGNYGISTLPSYDPDAHEVFLWMRVKDFYVRQITCHHSRLGFLKYSFVYLLLK